MGVVGGIDLGRCLDSWAEVRKTRIWFLGEGLGRRRGLVVARGLEVVVVLSMSKVAADLENSGAHVLMSKTGARMMTK